MSFVEIKNLGVKLGSFELKNINLKVNKGEFLSVIGRSGSGKTVLLESIAGLHKTKGEIWLDNKNITSIPPQKRGIGIVYQDYMLFPNMSVKKNILYPSLFHKNTNTQVLFDEIVSFMGISNILKRKIHNLSGGEKQKVAIARALLSNPELLLLDEPLNAVDLTFKLSFMEFLKDLHRRYELTVLYVTHNIKEALFFSDRCVVMLNGEICQDGSIKELFKHPSSKRVANFLGFKNILPLSLLKMGTHDYFSVSPNDIVISSRRPDKEFVLKAEVSSIAKAKNRYKIQVLIDDNRMFVDTDNNDFSEGQTVFIGFDKKDIGVFN